VASGVKDERKRSLAIELCLDNDITIEIHGDHGLAVDDSEVVGRLRPPEFVVGARGKLDARDLDHIGIGGYAVFCRHPVG
jgi:hypothetical protein